MIIEVLSYIGTAMASVGIYAGVKSFLNRERPISTPIGTTITDLPKLGFTTTDYTIPVESEEEYLKRLKSLHSEAWQTYVDRYSGKKLLPEQDRYINMLILKYKNNEIKAKLGSATLNFDEGTEIWTGNKYYSFGYIWRSKRNMEFGIDHNRISPYTFMCLVDLEMEIGNFSNWKRLHDTYERAVYERLKNEKLLPIG